MSKWKKEKIVGAVMGVALLSGLALAASSDFVIPSAMRQMSGFTGEGRTPSARDLELKKDAFYTLSADRRAMDLIFSCRIREEEIDDLKTGPSVEQARQSALCVIGAVPSPSEKDKRAFEADLKSHGLSESSPGAEGYLIRDIYQSGMGAMMAFTSLSVWQNKAMEKGMEPPKESLALAQEGLARAKAGIKEELIRGKKTDARLFFLDPRRQNAQLARIIGSKALQSYWMTMKPEARENALKDHIIAMNAYKGTETESQETTEFMRMREEALAWGEEEVAAIERSIEPQSKSLGWLGL